MTADFSGRTHYDDMTPADEAKLINSTGADGKPYNPYEVLGVENTDLRQRLCNSDDGIKNRAKDGLFSAYLEANTRLKKDYDKLMTEHTKMLENYDQLPDEEKKTASAKVDADIEKISSQHEEIYRAYKILDLGLYTGEINSRIDKANTNIINNQNNAVINVTPITPIGNSAPTRNKDDVNTDDVNKDDANKDAKKDDANNDIANNSKPADERNTMIDPDYKDPYYNMLVKSIDDFRKMFGDNNLIKGLTDPAGSVEAASKFGWNALSNTYSSVKNKVEEIKNNYSNAAQAIGNGFTYLANKEVPNKNDKADTSTEHNSDTVPSNNPSK